METGSRAARSARARAGREVCRPREPRGEVASDLLEQVLPVALGEEHEVGAPAVQVGGDRGLGEKRVGGDRGAGDVRHQVHGRDEGARPRWWPSPRRRRRSERFFWCKIQQRNTTSGDATQRLGQALSVKDQCHAMRGQCQFVGKRPYVHRPIISSLEKQGTPTRTSHRSTLRSGSPRCLPMRIPRRAVCQSAILGSLHIPPTHWTLLSVQNRQVS